MRVIPATWEAEIRRMEVPGQPQAKKFARLPPQQKNTKASRWHASVILVMAGNLT
jgi:hypothetical protein